jgi:hypothetical protein
MLPSSLFPLNLGPFIPVFLSCALQPLNSFVFQRIVYTKGLTGGPAAAAADTVIGLNKDRSMLICNRMHSTDNQCITVLAVMFTYRILHYLIPPFERLAVSFKR